MRISRTDFTQLLTNGINLDENDEKYILSVFGELLSIDSLDRFCVSLSDGLFCG